ncbi:MAG: hypothetical protein WBP85_04385 [Terracidiphilus sp.]
MRILRGLPLLAIWLAVTGFAADHAPPAVQPATTFPAVEIHADEHVAIAIEPYDTKEKESIFRFDYAAYEVLPVRLIVTNLGDKPISLRDARILFETANGERIQAAEPEDVERMMTSANRRGKTIPLPAPLPSIHMKPKDIHALVEQDFDTFEYSALAVEPHTTRAGFLFYDVTGLSHPLVGARLYVRSIRDSAGNELFYFEIPFEKYLQSKSNQMN